MEKIESPVGANDLQSVLLEIPEPVGAAANRQDDRVKTEESQGAVRLRQPQRHQMEMRVQCPDDLVAADHPVRMVAAVVEKLDIKKFCEPIRAREGIVGRDEIGRAAGRGRGEISVVAGS